MLDLGLGIADEQDGVYARLRRPEGNGESAETNTRRATRTHGSMSPQAGPCMSIASCLCALARIRKLQPARNASMWDSNRTTSGPLALGYNDACPGSAGDIRVRLLSGEPLGSPSPRDGPGCRPMSSAGMLRRRVSTDGGAMHG